MAESSNLVALQDFIIAHSPNIVLEKLVGMELANHVAMDYAVSNGKTYDKLTVNSGLKGYTGVHNAEADKLIWSDRIMKVAVLQDDYFIDPEKFRKKWQGIGVNITNREIPKAALQMQQIVKKNVSILNNQIFFNAVLGSAISPTNPEYLTLNDGINKQLNDGRLLATSNKMKTMTTGVLTGGVASSPGLGTVGNIVPKLLELDELHDIGVKSEPRTAFLSRKNFKKFLSDYKTMYPGVSYTTGQNMTEIMVDEGGGMLTVKSAYWMGNSDKIIITPQDNIVFGTDITGLDGQVMSSILTNYGLNLSFKMVQGAFIIDFQKVAVNEAM